MFTLNNGSFSRKARFALSPLPVLRETQTDGHGRSIFGRQAASGYISPGGMAAREASCAKKQQPVQGIKNALHINQKRCDHAGMSEV